MPHVRTRSTRRNVEMLWPMAEVSKSSPAVFRKERKEDSLVDDRLKLFMISLPSSVCDSQVSSKGQCPVQPQIHRARPDKDGLLMLGENLPVLGFGVPLANVTTGEGEGDGFGGVGGEEDVVKAAEEERRGERVVG